MLKQIVYIALACDDNYANHAAVVIASAIGRLHRDWRIHATLLHQGLSPGSREVLDRGAEGGDLVLFDASENRSFSGLKTTEHWTTAMYLRLCIGEALPASVDRVIYLDCDVLIRSSLHELAVIDLGDAWVGVVENPAQKRRAELKIRTSPCYFNSGVLVIDVARWRREMLAQRALVIAAELKGNLLCPDQDILNVLYDGRVHVLNPTWNVQVSMFALRRYWRDIAAEPRLVHFTTNVKPWHGGDPHPFASEFRAIGRSLCLSYESDRRLTFFMILLRLYRWLRRYFLWSLSTRFTNLSFDDKR